MENWSPSIIFDINAQRQAERRAASARHAQVAPARRPVLPVRTVLAGLLMALAARLAPAAPAPGSV